MSANSALSDHGGGNLNPSLITPAAEIEAWQDLRVGLSIHWGPSSLGGKEIGWSRGKEIPRETYDQFYRSFDPTAFDATEWTDFMQAAGFRYVVITTKHHDGFALWPSDVSSYDIANTPFKRDILGELAEACAAAGIEFGAYYSIIDWYHHDYLPYDHGGPGPLNEHNTEPAHFPRYVEFMKAQLAELIERYDPMMLQFDGEWVDTFTREVGADVHRYVRDLNPRILVNSRIDKGRFPDDDADEGHWNRAIYAGDFEERERMVEWINQEQDVHGEPTAPWQAWVTIDRAQWSWNETPKLLTSDEIIVDLVQTVGDNGNYLINVPPRPDGSFDPTQKEIMIKVGSWLQRYGEAIYATRGGPWGTEGAYTSTRRDGKVYLFVIDAKLDKIELRTTHPLDVFTYSGEPVVTEQISDHSAITLPNSTEDSPVRVLVVTENH